MFLHRILLSFGLGLAAIGASAAPHSAKDSLDWQGLYVGTLPCASCPDYYTELKLTTPQHYRLHELAMYKGQAHNWRSHGRFQWQADGLHIALGQGHDKRRYFVGENFVEQLAQDGSRISGQMAPLYRLNKMDRLQDAAGSMLVARNSLRITDAEGATVHFSAQENFAQPSRAGQRSLRADYSLQCKAKTYEMQNIQYFDELNGQGKALKVAGSASIPVALGKNDVRMRQVFARYCPPN